MATIFSKSTTLIPPSGTTSDFGAMTNVTFGDLDGDGDLDGLLGNISSSTPLRYFQNSGSATSPSFTEQTGTSNPFNSINTGTSLDETITGIGTVTSAFTSLVDIDNDGDLDLFTGSVAGNIRYYENTDSSTGKTTPTFAATTTSDTIGANTVFGIDITEATSTADLSRAYSTITFVDIDGDGDLDSFISYYNTIDYYENTGSVSSPTFALNAAANPFSGFTFTVASDAPSNGNRVSLDFVRLEGRSTYDAFVVNDDGSIRYFENTGSTTSPTLTERTGSDNPFNSSISNNTGTGRSAPTFVDIDNDGDNEAFFGAENNNFDIQFFENGPDTLTHTSGGAFAFGNTTNGSNLAITVSSTQATQITNVNLTFSGSSTANALFSVLPDSSLPNSFSQDSQTYILQNASFSQGQSFTISFEQFSGGNTTTVSSSQVTAVETSSGSGVWTLSVDTDGNGSTDLQFTIEQTTNTSLAGTNNGTANTQFNNGSEIVELTAAATGTFTLYREAQFNNVAGLYRIDDASGAVGGVAPGSSGYAQAAIQNRVTGADLQVGNQQTSTVSGVSFDAGLYAPFIVVDSTVDNFLSNGGTAYFAYSAANTDGQDHLILLGNNLFGFEDLSGGGDFDYNDMIIQVAFT
ncbi:MAG: DUF4114 domain-containing protein [Spirulina sp. SIO3F2]|nr:DUF4114 domain-containing protein [Spirulina sp. SIO3F2]